MMLPNSHDDATGGNTYLEPRSHCMMDFRKVGRQFSTNDSGIVELHGSRSGSRVGLSIPNDTYRAVDSDQESFPVTPRALYPSLQRTNGHAPIRPQFSYPLCNPAAKPVKYKMKTYEDMALSNRNKDDSNLYTSIDEATLVFGSDSASKAGDVDPLMCSFRPFGSRQTSIESAQAKGRENILYEPPKAQHRLGRGAGKDEPLSGKRCFLFLFCLIALAALVLSVSLFVRSYSNANYDELRVNYESLKADYEKLNQSLRGFQHTFDVMLQQKISEINESVVSMVASNDDNIGQLLYRLLSNDSHLQQRLVDNFENKMDLLKAEISSMVDSKEKEMTQLVSQSNSQLMMHLEGLVSVNMSACERNYRSVGVAATEPEYRTDEYDLSDKFVLRAFCTTEHGTEAFLEYSDKRPNIYRCVCRGRRDDAPSRYCIFHYTTCPYV